MKKIYVCSPYRASAHTGIETNIERAKFYCHSIITKEKDAIPIAPHIYLTQFLDDRNEEERALALEIDKVLLRECDELRVFGDVVSDGMAAEISEAARHKIQIRWFTTEGAERISSGKENVKLPLPKLPVR